MFVWLDEVSDGFMDSTHFTLFSVFNVFFYVKMTLHYLICDRPISNSLHRKTHTRLLTLHINHQLDSNTYCFSAHVAPGLSIGPLPSLPVDYVAKSRWAIVKFTCCKRRQMGMKPVVCKDRFSTRAELLEHYATCI